MANNKPTKGEIWAFKEQRYLILETYYKDLDYTSLFPLDLQNTDIIVYPLYHFTNMYWKKIC